MASQEVRIELAAKTQAPRDHLPSCEVTIWLAQREKSEAE
jgi:hypothetical protein